MKKVILMLAFAASLMVVSCGKGDGKAAGSDSAAAVEQTADDAAEALPTEPFTLKIRGVESADMLFNRFNNSFNIIFSHD